MVKGYEGTIEFPEVTDVLAEQALEGVLRFQIRNLYDFFDVYNTYISVVKQFEKDFYFTIDGNENGISYKTRIETENNAFLEAFKVLESKLIS